MTGMIICGIILALLYMLLGALSQLSWHTEFCTDSRNYPKLYRLSSKDKESIGWLVFLFWPIPGVIITTLVVLGILIWCLSAPFIAASKLFAGLKALFNLIKGD